MKLKKIILLVFIIPLLSGCTITYNLDISEDGFKENVDINAISSENLDEYTIPAYFGVIGYEDVDKSFLEKIEGVEYYHSKLIKKDDLIKLNYNYEFDKNQFKDSNFINFAYNYVVVKRYDHDEDGKKDYMIISTDNKNNILEKFPKIENIKVSINCHYEVISSNADEVNKGVYTWYLNRDESKAINIVYNPDKTVDYRTLWEKLKEGEYFNIFTVSLMVFIVGIIIYVFLKSKGEKRDKI